MPCRALQLRLPASRRGRLVGEAVVGASTGRACHLDARTRSSRSGRYGTVRALATPARASATPVGATAAEVRAEAVRQARGGLRVVAGLPRTVASTAAADDRAKLTAQRARHTSAPRRRELSLSPRYDGRSRCCVRSLHAGSAWLADAADGAHRQGRDAEISLRGPPRVTAPEATVCICRRARSLEPRRLLTVGFRAKCAGARSAGGRHVDARYAAACCVIASGSAS